MITDAGMRPRFYEKEQDMQKNDIVTADIEDIGVNGEGIGKVDGYTLFIKDAVIGENIVNLRGLLKQTMSSLKDCNVYMISQGASFVNISFVVDRASMKDAVREVHRYLFENNDYEGSDQRIR